MHELDVATFTQFVAQKVEDLKLGEITLSNPDINETFPIAVLSNVMQSIKKTENNFPIYSRFSITIEWWTNSKYESMNLFQKTNNELRKYNFAMLGTPVDMYDEVTKKHRYGGRYEVNYNGLINSFERVI